MSTNNYETSRTALLFVDPYNDFLAEGGKMWPGIAEVATEVNLHKNLKSVTSKAREIGMQIFIVPHQRHKPGEVSKWKHVTPFKQGSSDMKIFEEGAWGGEWYPDFAPQDGDIIVKEHWGSSGFANTDLDFLLKQREITHVILIGLIANTCIETTGKYASELGYHVTLITDATAAFGKDAMHAAHVINGPTYAHALLSSKELLAQL